MRGVRHVEAEAELAVCGRATGTTSCHRRQHRGQACLGDLIGSHEAAMKVAHLCGG